MVILTVPGNSQKNSSRISRITTTSLPPADRAARWCAIIFRSYWKAITPGKPACIELSGKTYEFVEFLDKILKVNLGELSLQEKRTFTYHYTCHLRGIGVKDEGVRLLRQIGNVAFVPMEKTDQCCGFGGTFAVKYPAISGAIVEDKINCIAATNAETTICNDAGCTMNISGMCHRHEVKTEVKHFAEIMAEALGIDIQKW